ncbi:MAG: ATP-binding cassette domain-containing protein [Lachnospiraceae bacterium]|nr:ATP-binding cassette domain-containing protein [Lachnospiraceae bacterium]
MGLYTKDIINKEENNVRLEQYADESLIRNRKMRQLDEDIEDVRLALVYLLDNFGIHIFGIPQEQSVGKLIETILDPLGMMYQEKPSVIETCRDRSEHVLAFRRDGKAVILMPTTRGYRFFCPFDASEGRASSAYIASLKAECYTISRPIEERKNLLSTFFYNVFASLTVQDILRLTLATALAAAFGYILPLVNKWIYNVYIKGDGSRGGFFLAAVIFASVCLVRGFLTMLKSVMLSRTRIRVSARMQSAVMAKVLHLSQDFFRNTSSGKLSQRIANSGRLSDTIMQIIMDVTLDLSFSLVYLYQMDKFAPVLFLPAIIFIILKFLVSILGAISYARNEADIIHIDMENNSFMFSVIRGIQKIKGMGAEKAIYYKWADMYRQKLSLTYHQPFILKYNTDILSLISIVTTIALLGISMVEDISKEMYMTFISSYTLVLSVVSSVTDIMQSFFLISALSENIKPIFEAQNEESESLEYVEKLKGAIKAENIWFSYKDDSHGCLKGISIQIKPGERVAIVGESGCGKSTLLKILLGMEIPSEGGVSYDGKSLKSLNLRSLRGRIGSVLQFSKVFPGTITDNVIFGSTENYDEGKIWAALDKAEIGEYIRSLPMKLDTEISESVSCGFSGGQRQRILLARAFIDDPKVLILDEATSALDNVTQTKVMENICNMKSTVIMVAHRLSTVMNFDHIIMLENGVIAEEGTYQELIDKNGRFAELVKKQMQ